MCPCGAGIPLSWSICKECLEIYGVARNEWPRWFLYLANDLNREGMTDRRHDEIAYNDEFDYIDISVTVEGQHYTRRDGWGPYSDS